MIFLRSMHSACLSNTYLLADRPGGKGILIDSGGPMEPIVKAIQDHDLAITHILCTHHHPDHIAHNGDYRRMYKCEIAGHPLEGDRYGGLDCPLEDNDELRVGGLEIRALHIPGHTLGQLAFLVNNEYLFTGDTLFRGSVGGTCGAGSTTFEDLHHSIMKVLMRLPGTLMVHPGHSDPTTIGREWEANPFVRAWRGVDQVIERPCTALGQPATLLLRARDYDGGTKCWVRFKTRDGQAIVPGSQVPEIER